MKRAYGTDDLEALLARNLLRDWLGEKFLTQPQYHRMEQDTFCGLRRTSIFLRLVLFLFTLIVVGAAVALFFSVSSSGPAPETGGIFLLMFAAVSYAAAEYAVSEARLYRYGIEEALSLCSVGFLCGGIYVFFFSRAADQSKPAQSLVPVAGVVLLLWIWYRFGLSYAFVAALIFGAAAPRYWTSSRWAQHLMLAGVYLAGLGVLTAVRSRNRAAYFDRAYSLAEAFLWLGVYLAFNLQLSSADPIRIWAGLNRIGSGFPSTFYWATWAVTWSLPAVILARGLLRRDRFVTAVGGATAILTLVTNKSYLGWVRHSWDPMLLGGLLIGVALLVRRWLDAGPGGIRHGFTARRLSGKDKQWMATGSAALGLASPPSAAISPEVRFGGGQSGGGGASSDF